MFIDSLSQNSPIRIQPRVELAPYTTFGIGGPPALFGQPESRSLLEKTLGWADEQGYRLRLFGGESGVLVANEVLCGPVLGSHKVNRIKLLGRTRPTAIWARIPRLVRFAGHAAAEVGSAVSGMVGAN